MVFGNYPQISLNLLFFSVNIVFNMQFLRGLCKLIIDNFTQFNLSSVLISQHTQSDQQH